MHFDKESKSKKRFFFFYFFHFFFGGGGRGGWVEWDRVSDFFFTENSNYFWGDLGIGDGGWSN